MALTSIKLLDIRCADLNCTITNANSNSYGIISIEDNCTTLFWFFQMIHVYIYEALEGFLGI